MSTTRDELKIFYNKLLLPHEFKDYCPNGVQVEGKDEITSIAFAVSASAYTIKRAIELKVDTLVTHHGVFWRHHGAQTITGAFAKRIKPLIINDINLISFHLPLDAHLEIGNAKCIASLLEMSALAPFGDYKGTPIGIQGRLKQPTKSRILAKNLKLILGHDIITASADPNQYIESLGIITGGASGEWRESLRSGLDAYLTGEISEHDWNDSQEAGIHMFAGGHYATEKFGIQSLMKKTSERFSVECQFIEEQNPV